MQPNTREPDASGLSGTSELSSGYRTYALALVTITYMFNSIDRNILSILLQPIKIDLNLTDTQIGLVSGIAFAIFYACFAVPIAMLADRHNRGTLLSITLALFSGMTVLCGMAVSFVQIMAARIFTAIGESATNPCSHSVISDMYPPQKRASALGVYAVGANLGILVGFLVGGWVGQLYGWRVAFFVVGAPGLLLALLIKFTWKEPPRGLADNRTAEGAAQAPGLVAVLKVLWAQKSFRHIICGAVTAAISLSSAAIWFPAFLMRSYGMQSGEIGTILAFLMGGVGTLGGILAGMIADRLGRRDVRWNVWMVAIMNLACFPLYIAIYSLDSKWLVLGLFVFPALVWSAYIPPVIAMTHGLVAVRMRAQATAIFFLFQQMVGAGLGPQITGMLSDFYHPSHGENSLRYALMLVSITWLWSAVHYLLAARTLKADLARAREAGLSLQS